jgi:hypothetical protein
MMDVHGRHFASEASGINQLDIGRRKAEVDHTIKHYRLEKQKQAILLHK